MATYPKVRVAQGQLSAAEVNANSRAGTVIVEGESGRTITVVDGWLRAIGGNAAGATAVVLEDTDGTDAVSAAAAGLAQNVYARFGGSNITATGVGTALTKHEGLRIGCTVGDLITATALDYCVFYTIDA